MREIAVQALGRKLSVEGAGIFRRPSVPLDRLFRLPHPRTRLTGPEGGAGAADGGDHAVMQALEMTESLLWLVQFPQGQPPGQPFEFGEIDAFAEAVSGGEDIGPARVTVLERAPNESLAFIGPTLRFTQPSRRG